jgi:hypothetical protein
MATGIFAGDSNDCGSALEVGKVELCKKALGYLS